MMIDEITRAQVERLREAISRRKALACLGGALGAALIPGMAHAAALCEPVRSETSGPFPTDARIGPNLLAEPAIFRSDIRPNLDGSNLQPGLPFSLTVTVVDINRDCTPLAGAAVYLWHCNADGEYSAYLDMGQGDQRGQTFLRGVQLTDAGGQARFTTVYPGRYPGRATHFHARIYRDGSFGSELRTTQFAFEDSINDAVYADGSAYRKSRDTRATPTAEDSIFRDGYEGQLLALRGDPVMGYEALITAGVAA